MKFSGMFKYSLFNFVSMKKTFATVIIICICCTAKAQLANTTWTGTVLAGGDNLNVLWKLASDTSFFYNNDDSSLLDVSIFKVQDSTISIRKVSGLSNCGEDEAVYTFILKDNNLNLYLTKDDCSDRSGALDKAVFTRKD